MAKTAEGFLEQYNARAPENRRNNMDFKNVPVTCHPAYTWLWNGTVTKEETARQIDQMYQNGIRAFYALGEPERFLPNRRRTYLKPEYLSDEYMEMVYFAFEYADKKGMNTWLYNEGGFPSGMACGKIRDAHPELAIRDIKVITETLAANTPYKPCDGLVCAFAEDIQVKSGDSFDKDTQITQYVNVSGDNSPFRDPIRTDIAHPENIRYFLESTHEALYKRFGTHMGKEVTLMFDDEASMGKWTEGMERLFFERYGYDICEFMPCIFGPKSADSYEKRRAVSDYYMLCGELVRKNYFRPMREWLNRHGMKSTGHLNSDNTAYFCLKNRYGNAMATLREYDVPGIDVIWSQIISPKNGKCCNKSLAFFPRYASSAARQMGHSVCMSESFAVYGAHVVPDDMRAIVNFQAVQGISLFNFMVMSYERKDARCLQYRPNYIGENPGMDCLSQINNYTARLSYILQSSKADIKTALYYPQRTICVDGDMGKAAADSFEEIGYMLIRKGVSFDIIDEELVQNGKLENGCLVCKNVTYENVFVPAGELEFEEVTEKLRACGKNIIPDIQRKNDTTLSRKLLFDDGSQAVFVVNTHSETVTEDIGIASDKIPYIINLENGDTVYCHHTAENGMINITLELLSGNGAVIWLTDKPQNAKIPAKLELAAKITDFKVFISRKYEIDPTEGVKNTYFEDGENIPLGEWDRDFSGEATYIFKVPQDICGEFVLDLGEVRHYAKIYINGEKAGVVTMPPYRLDISIKGGDEIKTVVANTPSNATYNAEFFNTQDTRDIGGYHARMILEEEKMPSGGLIGEVKLYRKITELV